MKKRDVIAGLADLDDDAEVLLAIITPKDENESFDIGADENSAPDEEDDDDTVDNGDGTVTNFEDIDDVQILENEDPLTGTKEKFAVLTIDMVAEDEDETGDDEADHNSVDNI